MRILSQRALALRATSMICLLAAFVAGCAAPAGHAALDRAGAAIERARSAPRVRALAATELDRAEVALEHARAAARAGAPPDQVEHLAYVVSQRAALAEARAAEQVARSEVGKLQGAPGQVLAHGRLDGQTRAPLRDDQWRRALGQMRLEHDRQIWASAAQGGQQAGARVQEDQQALSPLEVDQQTRTRPDEDQPGRARGQMRLEHDRQTWASAAQGGQQAGARVQEDRQALSRLEVDQQIRTRPDEDQRGRARGQMRPEYDRWTWASAAQGGQQAGTLPGEDPQEPAPMEEDQQARAPLEEERQLRASMQADLQARGALEQNPRRRALVQEDQQAGVRMEDEQQERALVEDDRQARGSLEEDQERPAHVEEGRQLRASVEEDQQTRAAAPDDGAVIVTTMPQEITLSLAQLPFAEAEPTSAALEQLTALAARLLREPGLSVSIEAEFDLPDPAARTVMERRVEIVRAVLLRRGIEPARLVVRAVGDGPMEPPATSPLVEPPD